MQIELIASYEMDQGICWECNEDSFIRCSDKMIQELGLNIGEFLPLETIEGKVQLLQIQNSKILKEAAIKDEKFSFVTSSTLTKFTKVPLPLNDVTIGCDPELFMVNDAGKIINASYFLNKYGQIGSDGFALELRPQYHSNPIVTTYNLSVLIKGIKQRLQENSSEIGEYTLVGKSHIGNNITAGFHIHFGMPYSIMKNKTIRHHMWELVRPLDYYLGIPSILPEGNTDSLRRISTEIKYGKPGDYRLNNKTFEYRFPGGILMSSPILSSGILCIGKVVVEDLVQKIDKYTNHYQDCDKLFEGGINELYPDIPPTFELFGLLCSPDTNGAVTKIERIFKSIEMMPNYSQYKDQITAFYNEILNGFNPTQNLEKDWEEWYEGLQKNVAVSSRWET